MPLSSHKAHDKASVESTQASELRLRKDNYHTFTGVFVPKAIYKPTFDNKSLL